MAGGVFVDRPFSPNVKCVTFGFFVDFIYVGTAYSCGCRPNALVVALIFIAAYILLAWYDYAYGCSDVMFSGTGPSVHFAAIFKPQARDLASAANPHMWEPDAATGTVGVDPNFAALAGVSSRAHLAANQDLEYKKKVYFFHLVIVTPLLLYIGLYGPTADERVWGFAAGLGVIAGLYHGKRYISLLNV